MLARRIAGRYAEAIFDLAQQLGKTAEIEQELATLATVITGSPDLRAVLTHPEIPLAQKEALVSKAFGDQASREVLAVLFLLIKRGHDPDLETVHEIYLDHWNKTRRVLPVSVASAVPLTSGQADALSQVLTKRTGATVRLTQSVDPLLIAGIVVTMGDRVVDASARTTLEQLRASMSGV